jgi:hypothetical protein
MPARVPGFLWLMLAVAVPFSAARADLDKARAERDLEKRSGLALGNASDALKTARQAYDKGDNAAAAAALSEVLASVEFANQALKETGKDPRKHSKWFKRAEIDTRSLLRRLDAFQREMGFEDRPMLDKIIPPIQKIHDDLLEGLMEGKRK